MFMMSSMATQKKSALDWVQFGIGAVTSVIGMASSMGAFSGAGSLSSGGANIYSPTTGLGTAGPNFGHANGGYITGPGTSTSDSIPAMLSNGEYVLRASAVDKIGKGTLDAWNSHLASPVRRATGGIVGTMDNARSAAPQMMPQPEAQAPSETSIRVVMVDDQRRVGDFINSPAGEQTLVQFVQRNQMSIKSILG
jgi:hypothetical protein